MFLVMEIQKGSTVSNLVYSYETRNEAENKYHTILASAALSAVSRHSAVLLTDEGEHIKSECFVHVTEPPEPLSNA